MKIRKKLLLLLLSGILIISSSSFVVFADEAESESAPESETSLETESENMENQDNQDDQDNQDNEEAKDEDVVSGDENSSEKEGKDVHEDMVDENAPEDSILDDSNRKEIPEQIKSKSTRNEAKASGDIISISTIEELDDIRNDLEASYELECDLDLSEATDAGGQYYHGGNGWEPIGDNENWFEGTFDGKGHTISGLNSSGYENTGLFGTSSGTIKNLCVKGGTIEGGPDERAATAGIVAFNVGSVENCTNECKITTSVSEIAHYCAGIVGYNLGTIKKCVNKGEVNGRVNSPTGEDEDALYCAGIAAYAGGDISGTNEGNITSSVASGSQIAAAGGIGGLLAEGSIKNSTNKGVVTATSKKETANAGGITAVSMGKISNCNNFGEVFSKADSNRTYAGGISGYSATINDESILTEECTNSGYIHADNNSADYNVYCGGIVGFYHVGEDAEDSEINECSNSGTIYAKGKLKVLVGGIAGYLATEDALIECSSNSGKISGDVYFDNFSNEVRDGGIAGASEGVVYRSYNTGAVSCGGYDFNYGSSGGIVGYMNEGAITECYNTGSIKGFLRSAGICGSNYAVIADCYNVGSISGSSESDYIGGIVGGNFTGGKVGYVYNVGVIASGSSEYNGVIGYNGSDCTDNVYNLNWRGYAVDDHSIGCRCSYKQMLNKFTYDDFDFDNMWAQGTGLYKLPILINCADAEKQDNNKINLNNAPIQIGKKEASYTGSAITNTVLISGLKSGTDYSVSFSDNKNVGKANAVAKGKGCFTGTRTVTFKIVPKGTKLKKLNKGTKAITVVWKKQSSKMSKKRISGYQIQLATNKKFTSGKKTVKVTGYSKTKKKITGLKSKKQYYVRIRTYTTISGQKYYSTWSTAKTIKTK